MSEAQAARVAEAVPAHERRLVVLIDFDNLVAPKDGLEPSYVRHLLVQCLRKARICAGEVQRIDVRLYGGWLSADGLLSQRGSGVAAVLPEVDPFPLVVDGRLLRGSIELVTSLVSAPHTHFNETHRRRGSIPRIQVSGSPHPNGCGDETEVCPARILAKFTRRANSVCPAAGCALTARMAFVASEQKMVDTMIACDLLELSARVDNAVCLVSGDSDFVPPLIQSAIRGEATMQLLVPTKWWNGELSQLLEGVGVSVVQMEENDGSE